MVFRIYMEDKIHESLISRSNRLGVHPKILIFRSIKLYLESDAHTFEHVPHSDYRQQVVILGLTPTEFRWFKIEAECLNISRTCLVYSALRSFGLQAEKQLKKEL